MFIIGFYSKHLSHLPGVPGINFNICYKKKEKP